MVASYLKQRLYGLMVKYSLARKFIFWPQIMICLALRMKQSGNLVYLHLQKQIAKYLPLDFYTY